MHDGGNRGWGLEQPPRGPAKRLLLRPTVASGLLFLAVAAALWHACRRATDGTFTYALDDPYIHLAMARTLARDGVWGLSAHEFVPASSAPLWTALLGVSARLFGAHFITPLVLDLFF